MDKNRRNYGDSLVNIFSVERSSQESRGFSHERFNEFKTILQNHFGEMTSDVSHLFEVEVDFDN